jgi:ABC-2 type transport system ATP-binding protein
MRSSAIAVSGLRKAYGDKVVLDGIDFEVAEGSVFSMLGPNGAGKTTTVNVLATLLKADAGTVRVAGHDVTTGTKQVRGAIGVTGQFAAVDDLLTGRENLRMMADLKRTPSGDQTVTQLLERFDLVESADKMAATYSGGMRRKLDLAMTLVGKPQVIFLDEPTTGLDPRSRRTMWGIVRDPSSSPPSTSTRPTISPTGSWCSTRATWSPKAPPRNSSARSPAPTSGSDSPTSTTSTRRRGSCPVPPGTTRN